MSEIKPEPISGLFTFLNSVVTKIQKAPELLFFSFILIYHILVTLQGIDFNDEGFHLSIYQQILNDPESVQYGFWMWMTGIIGGVYMKLLPFTGALGIRVAGAVVNTLTVIIAYQLLKRYLNIRYLRAAIILLVLFIQGDAKNLYYNNLSALFYFLSAYFLFHGLKNKRDIFLLLSGFVIGLNVFNRIPNVLGMGMVLSIFYFGIVNKKPFLFHLKKSGLFVIGAIVAVLFVFLIMTLLGHFKFYLESLKMIFYISGSAKDADGLEGSYDVFTLLIRNIGDYARSARWALSAAGFLVFIGFINSFKNHSLKFVRSAVFIFNWLVVLLAITVVLVGLFNTERLLFFFTGLGLLSALLIFNTSKSIEIRLLAFIGFLIMLIHPYGSSEGIRTVVIYSLWLSVPIALDWFSQIRSFSIKLGLDFDLKLATLAFILPLSFLQRMRILVFGIIMLACVYNVIRFPYLCDRHKRTEMLYSVNNKFMRGIFTSQGRAEKLNELLDASSKYIAVNDIVLAFDCMPLYHFMTKTRPYVRNPCIWFYSNELFEKELLLAESTKENLPVVVKQNIKTTGEGSAWPEVVPAEKYSDFKRNAQKNQLFNAFIERHQYKQVWTNGAFSIFLPGDKKDL